MADFDFALAYIAPNEGEWSDDPLDKGGPTKWGITLKTAIEHGYDLGGLKAMTHEQAGEIYKRAYWFLDNEPSNRVAAKVFDIGVNMGPGRAKRMWVALPESASEQDKLEILVEVCKSRYQTIIERDPSQAKFERGWMRRAERLP